MSPPAPVTQASTRTPAVTVDALQSMLLGEGEGEGRREFAVLDVREMRQANAAHLLHARPAPLSGLELQARQLLPRRGVPIVLHDEDDAPAGPAHGAQALLKRLGFDDVRRLEGGLAAWRARGLPLVEGYNPLVKAFADLARVHYGTPSVSAAALEARRRAGRATRVIDVRPSDEYAFLSIAGASNHPGTELALLDLPPQPQDHLWAVNCFSRTRGIIGSTSLRVLAALRGEPPQQPIAFVEDGVMAWSLHGAPVAENAQGCDDLLPAAPEQLRACSEAMWARYPIRRIDAATLADWQKDEHRTLHVFDLRPASATDAPPTGVQRVAGGQLLMHFENLVATRGARVVLLDEPHRLRATVTAFWLTQLGEAEVFVLDDAGSASLAHDEGPRDTIDATPGRLNVQEVQRLLRTPGACVIDVGPSLDYEGAHLPGAFYLLPATLAPADAWLTSGRPVVFSSPDGRAASLAARDARERHPQAEVHWLEGGTQAWQAAGCEVESGVTPSRLLTPFDDDGGSVMRIFGAARHAAWRDYLAWERGLAARVASDPAVRFRFFD